uniref:Uncharacterized protein n=1 Tax=Timema cristinae TaxID=61476 RepID=A0A7R9CZC7_TIMCR|nr:unnamed protein product [Timema cristinae]
MNVFVKDPILVGSNLTVVKGVLLSDKIPRHNFLQRKSDPCRFWQDPELCVSLGFSLQYIRLTVFCWLAAMTHDMYTTFRCTDGRYHVAQPVYLKSRTHHRTITPSHHRTIAPSHHHTIAPSHHRTIAPSHTTLNSWPVGPGENVNLIPVADPKISSSFCKYSLFGWGSPLMFLAAAIVLQLRQRGGNLLDTTGLRGTNCWYTSVGTFSLFRFLDENAFLYGFVIPTLCLLVMIVLYLARSAVVIRYTVSMQVDKKVRDKMRRKRNLQLCLFVKPPRVIKTTKNKPVLLYEGYSYHQQSINSKCTRKYWRYENCAISTARCITNLDVDNVVIYSCNIAEHMNPTDHAAATDKEVVTLLVSSVAAFGALFKLTGINAFWIAFNVGHGLQGIAVALCVTCNCQVRFDTSSHVIHTGSPPVEASPSDYASLATARYSRSTRGPFAERDMRSTEPIMVAIAQPVHPQNCPNQPASRCSLGTRRPTQSKAKQTSVAQRCYAT